MQLSFNTLLLSLSISFAAACATKPAGLDSGPSNMVDGTLDKGVVIAEGSFTGANDHEVKGTVRLVDLGGKAYLRLDDSFTLDGAPDPKVGFGRSGAYDESSTVSALKRISGAQDYALPAEFKLDSFNEAYIWCDDFSVALGVAELHGGAVAGSTGKLDRAAVVAQGSFTGDNDHVVTGNVRIVEQSGRSYLRLDQSFTLDGAPDPKVGFGTSGSYDKSSTVSALKRNSGAQDYALPTGFQLGSHNEVYIWCDQFSVALGVAKL